MNKYTRFMSALLVFAMLVAAPGRGKRAGFRQHLFRLPDVSTEFWVASHAAIIGALEGQGLK
jgi:hypothetical protein